MALVAGLAVGFGLLLVFDSLTRPPGVTARSSRMPALPQLGGALLGGTAAYALTGWLVLLIVGAVLGGFLPGVMGEQRSLAKRIEFTDAIAEAAARLRDAVRGGLGLSDGLAGLAVWGSPILRNDLAVLAADASRTGLGEAAARFARRVDNPGGDLLAATLAFNDRVGGREIAEVLDAMAEELAAEARTVRELRARQARQRMSARVVALAPVALLLILRQVNPGYLEAYDTAAGQAILGLAAALIVSGYLLMLRIARGIEPPRIAIGEKR